MVDVWWPTVILSDTLGTLYYKLGAQCLIDDIPQFKGLPHEDPNEHIKFFVEYCLKNGIFEPPHGMYLSSYVLEEGC